MSTPVPTYPLLPITKAQAAHRGVPGKSAFCVHEFDVVSYCQNCFVKLPVPIYPYAPIEKAITSSCFVEGKSVFCVQVPCAFAKQERNKNGRSPANASLPAGKAGIRPLANSFVFNRE